MARKLWSTRDRNGQAQSATFDWPVHRKYKEEHSYDRIWVREVGTYKDLVCAFMALGTGEAPFNAECGLANGEAQTVEDYVGQLVNDPHSRFYMYG